MSKVEVKQESRLSDLINYKLRVLTQDGRAYIGELLAFDKHMNLILNDCIEERIPKTQHQKLKSMVGSKESNNNIKVERRILGLAILRGEQILTTIVEDKPLISKKERVKNEKQQGKQLQKKRRQNKAQQGKVSKPQAIEANKRKASSPPSVPQQTKRFQPPPGFKRK